MNALSKSLQSKKDRHLVDLENKVHQQTSELQLKELKVEGLENEIEKLKSDIHIAKEGAQHQGFQRTESHDPLLVNDCSQRTVDLSFQPKSKPNNDKGQDDVYNRVIEWQRSTEIAKSKDENPDLDKLLKRKSIFDAIAPSTPPPKESRPLTTSKKQSLVHDTN